MLNQCNYRWVQNNSTDKSDPYYGKKVISYYDNTNWTEVENLDKVLVKHRIYDVIVDYEDAEKTRPIKIRTIVSGRWRANRPTIVHNHGFTGSGALCFKVI